MHTATHSFEAHFNQLTLLLKKNHAFWRESAYYTTRLDWQDTHPKLADAVLSLSDEDFIELDQMPSALYGFLAEFIDEFKTLTQLLTLPVQNVQADLNPRLNVDIPGRKWQQIEAFIGALPKDAEDSAHTVVDWCCGKSYLGRTLANHWQKGLHGVEVQPNLCESGLAGAEALVSPVTYSCKDVLAETHEFHDGEYVVALHACGDLHRTLVKQWRESESQVLALAPCCYHLWLSDHYPPLSKVAQGNNLNLEKSQVRLAVQEMVTASEKERQQVKLLGEWRMAFDMIQREIRGIDTYLPTQSIPSNRVKLGPEAIIRQLASKKQILIPDDFNFTPYLKRARQRYAEFLRLQLVNHGFRRALELWLVLDLALYLQEGDCEVELTQFCDRAITPRNFHLLARKAAGTCDCSGSC